jgi:hypothetical protein
MDMSFPEHVFMFGRLSAPTGTIYQINNPAESDANVSEWGGMITFANSQTIP